MEIRKALLDHIDELHANVDGITAYLALERRGDTGAVVFMGSVHDNATALATAIIKDSTVKRTVELALKMVESQEEPINDFLGLLEQVFTKLKGKDHGTQKSKSQNW